jgi:hypothetical protein
MPAIPGFIRHAPWPAYAAAAVALGATLAYLQSRRRRAARARVARALAATPVAPADWSDGAEVCLRGVLRADRAAVTVALLGFVGGVEQSELTPDALDDAALEVADTRVQLGAPVVVRVGSHVVRHLTIPPERFDAASVARAKVQRATELHVWRGGIDGYHVRRISPGDEVLARGRLRRDGDTWHLEPAAAAIDLVATRAVVDPVMMPEKVTMGRAMLSAAIAFLATAWLMAQL